MHELKACKSLDFSSKDYLICLDQREQSGTSIGRCFSKFL